MTTSRLHRRFALRVAMLGLAAAMLLPSAPAAAVDVTVVRVIRAYEWNVPSPDPTGLSYLPTQDLLVVVDSEVDETPHWEGRNVWFTNLRGRVQRSFSTMRYSAEPSDVAVGKRGKVLYFSDDNLDRIFIVKKGKDGAFGGPDDQVRSFATRPFGSGDPAGLGYGAGSLFVTDGDNMTADERVYRIRSGPNKVFDGVAPEGDDVVSSFPTRALGLRRPSDVAVDPETGHLFLVSALDDVIVETTVKGNLVDSWDFSGVNLRYPAGVVVAPGSKDATLSNVYVSDRGLDNNDFPNENDGRIFEFKLVV